jgi:integrase/recombinase XerD
MTPEAAIEIFCAECKHRHLSERTVEANRGYLDRFAHWCGVNHLADLREATLETLLAFHRSMKQHKRPDGQLCSIKYQNRHIRLVKQLFKLLAARTLIMADIGRDFPPLTDPRSLPRGIMNKDQVMTLLRQPLMTTPLGFRDRTMLEVLYSTGLRGGELCRLTLYDLDLPGRTLRVLQGKGRKDRVVPIGKVAAGYLGEYLKTVRPILTGPELTCGERSRTSRRAGQTAAPLVFISVRGLKLWTTDLGRIVKMYREQAHLPDTITTHSLRHTCATEMLKGGASIRHVQELLGHADIQTTQIYTHVVQSDLKKAHARTAPSERRKTAEPVAFDAGDGPPRWNDNRNAPYWKVVKQPTKRLENGDENR